MLLNCTKNTEQPKQPKQLRRKLYRVSVCSKQQFHIVHAPLKTVSANSGPWTQRNDGQLKWLLHHSIALPWY